MRSDQGDVSTVSMEKVRSELMSIKARVKQIGKRFVMFELPSNVRTVTLLLVILVVAFVLIGLWLRPKGFEERNEFVRTVAQVIGGFALLGGLYYTAQTVRQSALTLEQQQQRQHTDRYYEAIEQLGHHSEAVRIGALHSLKNLFVESKLDRDAIAEVMATFIRDRARVERDEYEDLAPEVNLAVHIFGTMMKSIRREGFFNRIDLKHLDLHYATFDKCCFDYVDFQDTNFSDGIHELCTFRRSFLTRTDFSNCTLIHCDFEDASMSDTEFHGTGLGSCRNLTWEQLSHARIDRYTILPSYLTRNPPDWYLELLAEGADNP